MCRPVHLSARHAASHPRNMRSSRSSKTVALGDELHHPAELSEGHVMLCTGDRRARQAPVIRQRRVRFS